MSVLTAPDKESFGRDGFVIKRGFFTADEIGAVINAFLVDPSIHKRAYGVDDGQGAPPRSRCGTSPARTPSERWPAANGSSVR